MESTLIKLVYGRNKEDKETETLRAKIWQVSVILTYVGMIIVNAISSAPDSSLNNTDNQDISDRNPSYVSPDGSTFSIWAFIYLFETFAVIYQSLPSKLMHATLVQARPWIALAFGLNASWLIVFAFDHYWLSAAVIISYFVALIQVYRQLGIHYGAEELSKSDSDGGTIADTLTWKEKVFLFPGFSLNVSWVAVASGVNLTTVLRQSGFKDVLGVGGSVDWAIMWVCIFGALATLLALKRGDVPYALGCSWALAGISRMQTVADATRFPVEALSEDLATWCNVFSYIALGAAVTALVKNLVEVYYIRPVISNKKTENTNSLDKSVVLEDSSNQDGIAANAV